VDPRSIGLVQKNSDLDEDDPRFNAILYWIEKAVLHKPYVDP